MRGIGSVKRYEFLEAGFALPRLAGGRLFADSARATETFRKKISGAGPDTPRTADRFRLEDIDISAILRLPAVQEVEAGVTVGRTYVNTGPGKDATGLPLSTFSPPGKFRRWRASRTTSIGARSCAPTVATSRRPAARRALRVPLDQPPRSRFRLFDFRRYEIDLRHFFVTSGSATPSPCVRARPKRKRNGQQVPFFLQPTAGGGRDLRGYDQSRFRDENALVLNLEYRWRIREMFQAVGFADAGRVFHRPGQIGPPVCASTGAGGRVKLGNRISSASISAGVQGLHIWFRSAHMF